MKKFIYAIIFASVPALAMSLSSCSDDDKDLPDVDVTVNVQNGVVVDNTIYVVKGDTLNITGLNVRNNEYGKGAAITNVKYFFNGLFVGNSMVPPFPYYYVTTADTPLGIYDIGVTCTIIAVDKSVATGYLNYPVVVVNDASDIPGDSADQFINGHLSIDD